MYKIIVEEMPRRTGAARVLLSRDCRISALSSADYCLRCRKDISLGSVAWRGTVREIRRLFRAERLSTGFLDSLEDGRDYLVLFLRLLPACA